MQLWNDYEGKTLAGTFPIETLLFTEGRHACFATHDRGGRPAVLRLTEALNDQEQMRARYSAIQGVAQGNLVSIEDFGDVEIEGTPLIYLVMEPTQENLADIVRERPLSIEETGEVALSLAAAVEALHAHQLVHGHVEPASVLAAGQVIKLRSDCVRAAPEGTDGDRARAEDIFGVADVIHRCLTQQRLQDASDALALPEPYASIVRNVVRGSWGIEQVTHEVKRFVRPAIVPLPEPVDALQSLDQPAVSAEPALPATEGHARGESHGQGRDTRTEAPSDPQLILPYLKAGEAGALGREVRGDEPRVAGRAGGLKVWVAGAAACLVLLLLWHFTAGVSKTPARVGPQASASPASTAAPVGQVSTLAIARPLAPPATHPQPAPARGEVWRVVAYTYNVEAQAQSKARSIAASHAGLAPQVFSRTGHAPFLVTLGGALTREQASAMRGRARKEGLARDVYMQNYAR